MEKLNEVKQALKYLEIDAKAYADNFSASMIVSTKNILAIAEAFRELEQRAEAAEAKAASNIIYQVRLLDGGENSLEWVEVTEEEFNTPTTEKYGKWEHRKLYTHPVPAADLAEMVPPEAAQHSDPRNRNEFYHKSECDAWNACRAAMLRKIEEAK